MEVRRVDPRDTEWGRDFPTYRVHFFTGGPGRHGWTSDEFELQQAPDVKAVIEWAEKEAVGRTYIIYALVAAPQSTSSGLLTLLGHDPNRPDDPRRPNELK
jgi:hypothetical protein